ncbi:hypothetical protein M8C21_026042 [Ambrosia artemisiifolia]|uniref:F-box domain-containing protein n=1 Tax=Ambrosia artemisiifolia TaxID=4212 RepID=A0AAD5GTQ5_AMBAR|nr:hypothetical protein M8C21_026042 [Ambrosia artemisiifolia]
MDTTGAPPSNKRRHVFSPTRIQALNDDIMSTVFSFLDLIHLIRCTAVCKSWSGVIDKSKLLQLLCCKQRGIFGGEFDLPTSSQRTWKSKLRDLAINQHRSAIDRCKMKMGLVLTGGSGKVMRLWSVERYKCLAEYDLPQTGSLVDFNFDESKEIAYAYGGAMRGEVYFPRKVVNFLKVLACDPEAVVGCEDGRARLFDMYGRKWSRIIKMHNGPVTCLTLSDDQLLIGGSSFGHISLSDLSSDQQVATLKTNDFAGLTTLCYNSRSHIVFSGSRSGRASSWDLRMMKQLWEARVSPNLISSIQHMRDDISILAVGGIDGVLRLVDPQNDPISGSLIKAHFLLIRLSLDRTKLSKLPVVSFSFNGKRVMYCKSFGSRIHFSGSCHDL